MAKKISDWFKKKPSKGVKTTPLSEEQLLEAVKKDTAYEHNHITAAFAHSIGLQRDHNEDAVFMFSGSILYREKEQNLGLYIVADGMGGHKNGAAASSSAARVFGTAVLEKFFIPIFDPELNSPSASIQEIMENAVKSAQFAVQKDAPGGGTTLTAGLVVGDQVTLAHVGDSRSYFIHLDGRSSILTQDHSLVHRLVELGQLDEEMAKIHPQRNVLYRAVGQTDPFIPDIATHQIPRPGYLLICSDGLWGVVNNENIVKIVLDNKVPANACEALVEAANQAGGPDNISVILAMFD